MIDVWGPVPAESVAKSEAVYGSSVARSWDNSLALISNADYLMRCLEAMSMDEGLAPVIEASLERPWGKGV
jgi:hypothetical protein